MSLTDAEISEIAARHEASDPDAKFWRDFARAIESAVLAKIATTPAASPIPIDARPLHPNHRPDLRYVRKVLDDVRMLALVEGDKLCGDVDAAINGMDYIIKRTEEAASTTPEPSPLVAPRWISVEDQMPELGVEVLVFKPGNKWGEVQFDTWNEQHEAPLSFSSATIPIGPGWDNEDDFYAITHWMLKPAAPVRATEGEA